MKRHFYKTSDGSVHVLHANNNAEDRVYTIDPTAVYIGEVADADMPSREYRDCWVESEGSIVVDLTAAKEKKVEEIRKVRDQLLTESDAIWVEIASKDEAQAGIQTYKQELRDMMPGEEATIAAISDVESLTAYTPTFPTKP